MSSITREFCDLCEQETDVILFVPVTPHTFDPNLPKREVDICRDCLRKIAIDVEMAKKERR